MGEAKEKINSLTINNVEYVRADSVKKASGDVKIIILQRGNVVVGRMSVDQNDRCRGNCAEAPAPPHGSPSKSSDLLSALHDAVGEKRKCFSEYLSLFKKIGSRFPNKQEKEQLDTLRSLLDFSDRTILSVAGKLFDLGR